MRSKGEHALFDAFVVIPIFEPADEEIIKDTYYKLNTNYYLLQEMLYVARRIHFFKKEYSANSFAFLVMGNLLTSINLAFRRITDDIKHKDNRSFYNLVLRFDKSKNQSDRMSRLRQINKRYEKMNDKFCAHQDSLSIQNALKSFPNSKSIKKDMAYILAMYREIGLEFFTRFPSIDTSKPAYYKNLRKILEIQ